MEVSKEVKLADPQSHDSMDEDNSDNDDETWDEIDADNDSQIVCLFCPQVFKTMVVALEHCKIEHHFNLVDIKVKLNMDCYSYICMVNYIRKEGVTPDVLISAKEIPWLNENYLTPVLQDDPWLMFDFDGLESPLDNCMDPDIQFHFDGLNFTNLKAENGVVTLSESSFAHFQQILKYYMEQVQKKESMLSAALQQINEMKTVAAKIVCGDVTAEENELDRKISIMKLADDNGYFRTYSHFGIHHEMLSVSEENKNRDKWGINQILPQDAIDAHGLKLCCSFLNNHNFLIQDEVRTTSFRDAIVMNTSTFSNKTVLDVGCGSGILSMFAASANAEKVFGVDQSEIIFQAADIVRENNLSAKIDLIHAKIEDITLPVEKVDIIVSEWLGYFLLFEGMLDSVFYARDKFLKPDGLILPNRCCLFLTGLSDHASYAHMVGFWSSVYGYKMSCLAKEVLREALISDVPSNAVATSSALVFDLNLYVHGTKDTHFTSDFTLECQIDGDITALCGYFDVIFNLPHEVSFSTSPKHPKTHWKQTIFYLPQPINVKKGRKINGQINCKTKPDDKRALMITIFIEDQKNEYILA